MLSTLTTVVGAAGLLFLYILYRWALPKPIPGIPYNPEAVNSLLGDIPGLSKEMNGRGDFFLWASDQNFRSQSAISQVFMEPFGKPAVIIADHRESRDIQTNRGKDFDRSYFITDTFGPMSGVTQFVSKTGPTWKKHRRLTQDTMTPNFLNNVAAPNIHASGLKFIELWKMKADIANGRPFSAESDMFVAALDAVLAFNFGAEYPYSATGNQVKGMRALSSDDVPVDPSMDVLVEFPSFEIHEEIESIIKLAAEMESITGQPLPSLRWFLAKRTAEYKFNEKLKNDCIRREVGKAIERLGREELNESSARNGIDLIVNREAKMAERENRKPDFYSDMIRNEVFLLLVAGHDTTSSTLCWSMKLLAKYQDYQSMLRKELQKAFPAAIAEGRQPSAREITKTTMPFFDAMMEELLRFNPVVVINSREAIRDTELLGHHIPKGTLVMYLLKGPGFTMPAYKVDEHIRSESSRQAEKDGQVKSWNDDDIDVFKPERWLVKAEDGSVTFDANAGPCNPFGLGLRSCFGRRLAYIQLRIFLVMIVWNFELLECPEELSSFAGKLGIVYKAHHTNVRLKQVTHSVKSG